MTNTKEREGIILIPDLSGFTEFVFTTKTHVGEYITKQLLSVLIDANKKHFYISEIEGDAILFYRYNKRPCHDCVMEVLERMQEAFNLKLSQLEKAFNTKIDMSLKFIVHHGKFSRYTIRDFKKLYGKPIIEAHRLLKNEYAEHPSYILFTNSFLETSKKNKHRASKHSVTIPEVGVIQYLSKQLKFLSENFSGIDINTLESRFQRSNSYANPDKLQ